MMRAAPFAFSGLLINITESQLFMLRTPCHKKTARREAERGRAEKTIKRTVHTVRARHIFILIIFLPFAKKRDAVIWKRYKLSIFLCMVKIYPNRAFPSMSKKVK